MGINILILFLRSFTRSDSIVSHRVLTRAIMDELRGADGPVNSREIARGVVALSGQDARDRKFLSDHTKRVSRALRVLRDENMVRSAVDPKGNVLWSLWSLYR
jgi:hypothetical protein